MAIFNNYDPVKYDGNPLGGFGGSARVDDPRQEGYTLWKEPTSNNSGRTYLRKKDDQEGVDYLYDRVVETKPVMVADPFTGVQRPKMSGGAMFGMEPQPVMETTVKYNRVKLAPGQSPEGYRQEETPRRYKATEEQGGQSRSYATRRSQAGARGTILTGRQGTNLGGSSTERKTVLGG